MAKRLFVDLKENHKGELTGTVKFPADSVFVFEALTAVIEQFAVSCEVPMDEIAADLLAQVRKNMGVVVR